MSIVLIFEKVCVKAAAPSVTSNRVIEKQRPSADAGRKLRASTSLVAVSQHVVHAHLVTKRRLLRRRLLRSVVSGTQARRLVSFLQRVLLVFSRQQRLIDRQVRLDSFRRPTLLDQQVRFNFLVKKNQKKKKKIFLKKVFFIFFL